MIVLVVHNPMEPGSWTRYDSDDLAATLREAFPTWPSNGRIYDLDGIGDIDRAPALLATQSLAARDVTPADGDTSRLERAAGPLLVTVPPADPLTAAITVAVTLAAVAIGLFLMPKPPTPDNTPSASKSLSDRQNKPRPGLRIEDHFGTVRAVPSLLTVPYRRFEDGLEVEIAYMCVGRGSYDLGDVRDGDTLISQVAGAAVEFYGPFTSPNAGLPQLRIGSPINAPVLSIVPASSVNGQLLRPPNANHVSGNNDIRFVYPDRIETTSTKIDFTKLFDDGDQLTVVGANYGGSAGTSEFTADARYLSTGEIEFATLDPSTKFKAGDQVTLSNAGNAGDAGQGVPVASRAGRSDNVYVATIGRALADGVPFEVLLNEDSAVASDAFTYLVLTDDPNRTYRIDTGGGTPIPPSQLRAGKIIKLVPSFGGNAWVWGGSRDSGVVFVDLSGTYAVTAISGPKVKLDTPGNINSDWNKLAGFSNQRTGFRSATFAIPTATAGVNLNGTYPVLNVAAKAITLSNPSNINAAWANVQGLPGGATPYGSASLSTSGDRWIGPFKVDLSDLTRVITNMVGLSGLYSISNKGKQAAISVGVEIELTPVDANDNPRGPAETFAATVTGSATNKEQVGFTIDAVPTFTGACAMRARRTTPTDLDFEGTLVDDVKWRDAYGAAAVDMDNFGNVTTVMAKTYATSGATSVKERKLNLSARRRVPSRLPDGSFATDPVGSDNMADIIAAVCLDPYIGARSIAEVDFDLVYDTSDAVAAYFGSTLAREFSYTFDDDNTSFEETLQLIAQACFCQGYRQGSQIKIEFERATEDSGLLFNHRNVLPDSQTRTTRFGILDDQDGVELSYTVPKDGAKLTITLPKGQTPASPRTTELPGIATYMLGWWQAQRAWNKMRYQHTTVELEATEEAAMVLPQQRVLIADMTRPDHLSGEVIAQAGVDLTLSDDAVLDPDADYIMFLQLPDATVQAIAVTAAPPLPGSLENHRRVVLASPPRLALVTDPDSVARTIYSIAKAADVSTRAFLVSEREPNSDFTETVRAVNYTFLYYQHDQLLIWMPFIDGAIQDESAWQRSIASAGDTGTVQDDARGHRVYASAAGGTLTPSGLIATPSYTKSAWFNAAPGASGGLLASVASGEAFGFDGSGNLYAGHAGAQVSVAVPAGEWHQGTVTYDAEAQHMALYVDGVLVDQADAVPRGSLAALSAFTGLVGRFDELRHYPRALTADEVRAIYMGTR